MSAEAHTFVVRHVRGITTAQRAILGVMAEVSNTYGRTRITQSGIAAVVELSRRQVERHARALQLAKIIEREGRTWVIVGVADHDIATCDHPWCVKEHRRTCRPTARRPRRRPDPNAWHRYSAGPPPAATTAMHEASETPRVHNGRRETTDATRPRPP